MPGPTYRGASYTVRNRETGESYKMPWQDVTKPPTREDIESYVVKQKNKGVGQKAWDWATEPLARVGSATFGRLGEALSSYGEGEGLSLPEGFGGFGKKPIQIAKPAPIGELGPLRRAGQIAGAYSTAVGEGVDELTSPLGLATGGGGRVVGKGLQGVGAARAGNFARHTVPKIGGASMVAHGGQSLYNEGDISDPSTFLGPLTEIGLGALGYKTAGNAGAVSKAKPKGSVVKGVTEPIDAEFSYNAEPVSEGVARATRPSPPARHVPAGQTDRRYGELMERFGGQGDDITTAGLPSGPPPARALPPSSLEARTATARARGAGTGPKKVFAHGEGPQQLDDITRDVTTRPLEPGVDEVVAPRTKDVYSGEKPTATKPRQGAWKSPSLTKAEEIEVISDPNSPIRKFISQKHLKELFEKHGVAEDSPSWQKAFGGQRGSTGAMGGAPGPKGPRESLLDIDEIARLLQYNKKKAVDKLGKARDKFLENIEKAEGRGPGGEQGRFSELAEGLTGKSVTNASAEGLWKSGWGTLEGMGEPGRKLSRLMQRARTDVNQKLAEAELAGKPMITDKGLPINQSGNLVYTHYKDQIDDLIKQIPEGQQRDKAQAIINRYAGREPAAGASYQKGVDAIKGIEALTKLSQFAIGNTSALASTAMRGNWGAMAKAFKTVTEDYGSALQRAKETGGLGRAATSLGNQLPEGKLGKVIDRYFNITKSEQAMRTVATHTGEETARELFNQLKNNPGNKKAFKRLDDLLLEDDWDSVLKQGKLTDDQLKRAGARMSELTSGIAESIDLPQHWTDSPMMDLIFQFKRYAFMQNRNMYQALRADTPRTLAALGLAFPLVGEAVGDVKAGIRGTVKTGKEMWQGEDADLVGNIIEEVHGRGDTLGKRYIANASQAWALGLIGDYLESGTRSPWGFAKEAAGPFFGDVGEVIYGAGQALPEGVGPGKGSPYHLARQAARTIPIIGTSVASQIKGSYEGRQGRKKNARGKNKKNN
jgi:hypothetical protein